MADPHAELIDLAADAARRWARRHNERLEDDYISAAYEYVAETLGEFEADNAGSRVAFLRGIDSVLARVDRAEARARRDGLTGVDREPAGRFCGANGDRSGITYRPAVECVRDGLKPIPSSSTVSLRTDGQKWRFKRNVCIVAAYRQGISQRTLAQVFDLPRSRIAAIIREFLGSHSKRSISKDARAQA